MRPNESCVCFFIVKFAIGLLFQLLCLWLDVELRSQASEYTVAMSIEHGCNLYLYVGRCLDVTSLTAKSEKQTMAIRSTAYEASIQDRSQRTNRSKQNNRKIFCSHLDHTFFRTS